jgi:hypothetical protein
MSFDRTYVLHSCTLTDTQERERLWAGAEEILNVRFVVAAPIALPSRSLPLSSQTHSQHSRCASVQTQVLKGDYWTYFCMARLASVRGKTRTHTPRMRVAHAISRIRNHSTS